MKRNPLWVVFMVLPLTACAYEGMLFVEHTHVGADITFDPTNGPKPVNVDFGYDRGLAALVPRTQSGGNAGSVISRTDLDIQFSGGSKNMNVFASGKAAKNITLSGVRVAALFGKCPGESEVLRTKKQETLDKLEEKKLDNKRLKKTHEEAFPYVSAFSRFLLSDEEILRDLRAFVKGVCDSNSQDKLADVAKILKQA
jgi:hypothetical protein